jgi:hypothetical protein
MLLIVPFSERINMRGRDAMLMSKAKNTLARWYGVMFKTPLGGLISASIGLFVFLTLSQLVFDPFILLYAAFMSLMVVVTILIRTERGHWTALNAGLLGVFFGIFFFFCELTYNVLSDGYEHRQTVLGVARSLFVVSTTWVLIGLFLEWWYEHDMTWDRFKDALRHPWRSFRQRFDSKE